MVVRIRFSAAPNKEQKRRKNQHAALALASLLTPAAVMAFVLACWRLAADLRLTGQFPITEGLFSHWQVWLAAAAVVQLGAITLNRYGKAKVVLPKTVEDSSHRLADSRSRFVL
jgi:hypothetical protein